MKCTVDRLTIAKCDLKYIFCCSMLTLPLQTCLPLAHNHYEGVYRCTSYWISVHTFIAVSPKAMDDAYAKCTCTLLQCVLETCTSIDITAEQNYKN